MGQGFMGRGGWGEGGGGKVAGMWKRGGRVINCPHHLHIQTHPPAFQRSLKTGSVRDPLGEVCINHRDKSLRSP